VVAGELAVITAAVSAVVVVVLAQNLTGSQEVVELAGGQVGLTALTHGSAGVGGGEFLKNHKSNIC